MKHERVIAYCGLVCTECPAYLATRNGDTELLRATAERWSTPGMAIGPDDIICDGCTGTGRRTKFCTVCKVRACARGQGVENCGACAEYPCAVLAQHWESIKAKDEAKPVLDEARRSRTTG